MTSQEREALVREIIERLEERGVPQGTWLIEIARAHEAARDITNLLARLQDAVIRESPSRWPR